jgi:hypothetical protein
MGIKEKFGFITQEILDWTSKTIITKKNLLKSERYSSGLRN